MSGSGSGSDIPSIAGMFGGLYLAALVGDHFGGNKVTFVVAWVVCGFIIAAVTESIMTWVLGSVDSHLDPEKGDRSMTKDTWKEKQREERKQRQSEK